MSSVYRDSRRKNPVWIGAFTDEQGRRRKQSTGTKDKREAEVIVDGWQKAADSARQGRLTEAKARQIVSDILERTTGRALYAPTAKSYLEDWLKREAGTSSQSMLGKKEQAVRLFLASLGRRQALQLDAISEADVVRLRDQLMADGRRSATVNHIVRAMLAPPFREALAKGLIRVDPFAAVKSLRGSRVEKGTFSPEQISRLVNAAEGDWRGLVLAAFYTGARLSDLAHLEWKSVDLVERSITFRQRKTDATVLVPMHPELESYLLSLPAPAHGNAPVFPSLYGVPTGGTRGLSVGFRQIMERAGIRSAKIRERGHGISRSVAALSFHSLRHSFNSALANAGVNQEIRQLLTGHASETMNTLYTHTEIETIRRAIEHLPRLAVQ